MTLKPKTQKAVRTGLWLLLDAVLINLAMILSQVLRYTTTISYSFFQIYFRIAPAMTLMGLILFAVFGLYRTMWQYASAEDLLRVVLSTLALAVCTYLYSVIANYFVRPQNLFRLHRLISPAFLAHQHGAGGRIPADLPLCRHPAALSFLPSPHCRSAPHHDRGGRLAGGQCGA